MQVLVVDDETPVRLVLRHALRDVECREAANGAEALDLLREDPDVDAVLLDVMMPELSGWDVLAAIRKDPAIAHLPVVMLTALTDEAAHLRGYRSGADAYITKPFDIEAVATVLREVTGLSAAERASRRRAGEQQAELLMNVERSFNR